MGLLIVWMRRAVKIIDRKSVVLILKIKPACYFLLLPLATKINVMAMARQTRIHVSWCTSPMSNQLPQFSFRSSEMRPARTTKMTAMVGTLIFIRDHTGRSGRDRGTSSFHPYPVSVSLFLLLWVDLLRSGCVSSGALRNSGSLETQDIVIFHQRGVVAETAKDSSRGDLNIDGS